MEDITLATWLSLVSQMILLIVFLRSLKRTLVEGMALIIGLCWTFGLVTLVVGHLNILSLVFAPLLLGLTIDYGIHWFCRLEEELAGQRCHTEALARTFRRSAPGIIYAGRAADTFLFAPGLCELQGPGRIGADHHHGHSGDAGRHPVAGTGPGHGQ